MRITVEFSAEEAERLGHAARIRGTTPDCYVEQAVRDLIPPPAEDIEARLARLDRIMLDPDDAEDQRETWEFLKKALDEDRLSYRKLFP